MMNIESAQGNEMEDVLSDRVFISFVHSRVVTVRRTDQLSFEFEKERSGIRERKDPSSSRTDHCGRSTSETSVFDNAVFVRLCILCARRYISESHSMMRRNTHGQSNI